MTTLSIDIISDIACPWCAIGYGRLREALDASSEIDAEISWRAFELNPDPDAVREPIGPALAKKYNMSEQQVDETQQQMKDAAHALGINFDNMDSRYTCNTFDAHRLVKWSAQFEKQTPMKLALFDAYFGHAQSVDEKDVLLSCAESAGLDRNEAQSVLESDDYAQAVRDEEKLWQQAGISSVPAFVINQKYLISGAQESDALVKALSDIAIKESV
ncbi:DsbA family oxidoreductase [Salinimonas sp. HHU 13199]|uniref:DsbA family oxidoreductase n=1 Tax=Salinimonas profundi TaxID=2729140 RepID=A0ABR8LFW5_9ALTE|nr:DsbA family oxidoreductase [Salinimonas profundi]MBD3584190.1 DsbA family oxidoreductase [Salinimonas profundi]